jgi:hypothetical protein
MDNEIAGAILQNIGIKGIGERGTGIHLKGGSSIIDNITFQDLRGTGIHAEGGTHRIDKVRVI